MKCWCIGGISTCDDAATAVASLCVRQISGACIEMYAPRAAAVCALSNARFGSNARAHGDFTAARGFVVTQTGRALVRILRSGSANCGSPADGRYAAVFKLLPERWAMNSMTCYMGELEVLHPLLHTTKVIDMETNFTEPAYGGG